MARDITAWLGFLAERGDKPFAWGRDANDCVSFQLASVLALTGRDLSGRMPRWSSEATAKRALARLGGLEAAVDGLLRPVSIGHAQRGDVAGVRNENGDLLLMSVEGHTLVGPGPKGLKRVDRHHMVKAWSAE
jgi:hypothetical protein